ncbi:MAG: amidohydrolase family protein [Phycisphaerales bacterium]|nr:MAG: amidohydrolase family protein [Phycisphaerales bacterium]
MTLREAHVHLPLLGRALMLPDFGDIESVDECLDRVREMAARASGWVLACGARVEGWSDRRWPTLDEFDSATGGVPACVMSFDYHAVLANTAAMRASGVDARAPEGGIVVRDADGRATGLLLEQAARAAWNAAPEPTPAERIEHVAAACAHLQALGFEEAHDLHAPLWLGPVLRRLHREGRVGLRVGVYVPHAELRVVVDARAMWEGPGLRLLGSKLFADGTLNSRTASVLHPYAEGMAGMERGVLLLSRAQLSAAMRECADLGVGLAVHAIGDRAVRAVLDARAAMEHEARPAHVRIEHAELIDAADVPRFGELGVLASVQPCHLLADIEALTRLVPDRMDRVMPWREMIDSGLRAGEGILFGSDAPIVRADPSDSIQAAVGRGRPGGVRIAAGQAITEGEAWEAFGVGRCRWVE